MKKIFYLASIAALAFSSCAKDETTEAQIGAVNGGAKITAAVEADDTRTSLEKVDGKYEFRWSAGDQLGVYGVGGGLNNAAFVLNNNSDGQAVGVFASQSTELKADKAYVAVYPRFQTSLFSAADIAAVKWDNPAKPTPSDTTDDISYPNYENVKVTIPAVQKYQPETFYTQTVPAVSTTFVVGANGAEVSMQPVVDYLFVNIKSTEPISKLKLELRDVNNNNIPIAGEGYLKKYILNKEYRYALNTVSGGNYITLEMDEASDAVTCHDANTYVFAVPAGIFGMGEAADVRARITVNNDTEPAFIITSGTGTGLYPNAHLNYYLDADDNKISRKKDGKWVSRQENTVFWANELKDGERTAFEYNPEGDVVIENEAELLEYLVEYEAGNTKFFGHDAFICDNYAFDFSIANIEKLSAKLKKLGEYEKYEDYLNDYVGQNGVFPCITNFADEFNGNGATITGIVRPLASMGGIFGVINGTVKDVTFANVLAASDVISRKSYYGLLLGTIGTGKIDDVVVSNSYARAILGAGDVADYKELTVNGVSTLNYIIENMTLNSDLEVKNWDAVKGVNNTVFASLNAATDGKTPADTHHVVKLPAAADYSKLAYYIGTDNNVVSGSSYTSTHMATLVAAGVYPAYPIDVKQNDVNVVSVLVGDTSIWTGDKFNKNDATFYGNTKLALAKYDKKTVINGTDVNGWSKAEYAEHVATGSWNDDSEVFFNVVLQRDMDFSKTSMNWEMVEAYMIEGNGKTLSGFTMDVTAAAQSVIAPVDAAQIKNLTIDGVEINIYTPGTTVVPDYISGFAAAAQVVENVTLKNLVITGAGQGANNEAYDPENPVIIGWLVAKAENPTIKNSKVVGVNNEIKGIAALVGEIELNDAAAIENSYAENVTAVQTALPAFRDYQAIDEIDWATANFAGTAVGIVSNTASTTKSIAINGTSGKAVFVYNTNPAGYNPTTGVATSEAPINVLYGNGQPVTLTSVVYGQYWW